MPCNESRAFQRLRNRIEQEKQNLQILDVSLLNSHKVARQGSGKLAEVLGYDEAKYSQLHVPHTQSSRIMAQAKNTNYKAAIVSLYSLWTDYMREILGLMYQVSPHEIARKAPGELKFSEIINLGDYDSIKQKIIDHVFRTLEDERSTKKLLDKILKHTKIPLQQSKKIHALAYLDMRHLFVHSSGIVDEKYYKTYHGLIPCTIGRPLPRIFKTVDEAYCKVLDMCADIDGLLIQGNFINVR